MSLMRANNFSVAEKSWRTQFKSIGSKKKLNYRAGLERQSWDACSYVQVLENTAMPTGQLMPKKLTAYCNVDSWPVRQMRQASSLPFGLSRFGWRFPFSLPVGLLSFVQSHLQNLLFKQATSIVGAETAKRLGIPCRVCCWSTCQKRTYVTVGRLDAHKCTLATAFSLCPYIPYSASSFVVQFNE
jgi:hypothetical protein